MFKLQMTRDRYNARQKLNFCLLPDPPLFSLPSTFKALDPDPDLKLWIRIRKNEYGSETLVLGLHKGSYSYRRSLQPSKENIQHIKT